MHKIAMEIGKKVMEEAKAKGLENFTPDDWEKLKYTMEIVKDAICADKDYRTVEVMDKAEQEEELMERMGYRGRDPRTGRFVHRSGRERSAGYRPYAYMMDEMEDYEDMYDYLPSMSGYRMGYTGDRGGNMGNSSSSSYGGGSSDGRYGYEGMRQPSRYGESYDRYKDNRRHYTENPTSEHQKMMKESADDVFDDIEEIAKKIYGEADTSDKAKIKQKMTQLVQKMQ